MIGLFQPTGSLWAAEPRESGAASHLLLAWERSSVESRIRSEHSWASGGCNICRRGIVRSITRNGLRRLGAHTPRGATWALLKNGRVDTVSSCVRRGPPVMGLICSRSPTSPRVTAHVLADSAEVDGRAIEFNIDPFAYGVEFDTCLGVPTTAIVLSTSDRDESFAS